MESRYPLGGAYKGRDTGVGMVDRKEDLKSAFKRKNTKGNHLYEGRHGLKGWDGTVKG